MWLAKLKKTLHKVSVPFILTETNYLICLGSSVKAIVFFFFYQLDSFILGGGGGGADKGIFVWEMLLILVWAGIQIIAILQK